MLLKQLALFSNDNKLFAAAIKEAQIGCSIFNRNGCSSRRVELRYKSALKLFSDMTKKNSQVYLMMGYLSCWTRELSIAEYYAHMALRSSQTSDQRLNIRVLISEIKEYSAPPIT